MNNRLIDLSDLRHVADLYHSLTEADKGRVKGYTAGLFCIGDNEETYINMYNLLDDAQKKRVKEYMTTLH